LETSSTEVTRKIKGVSIRLIVAIVILLISIGTFYIISDEAVVENESAFDHFIFNQVDPITSPSLTRIMIGITFFGSSYFLFPAYVILSAYYLIFKRNTRVTLNVAAVGLTSAGVLFVIKNIFRRHRPLHPLIQNVNGFSFPSGHSFSAFTFFGLLIYIIWKGNFKKKTKYVLSALFFLFAAAIAFSRVYLHVHFATDAIAGFCLCIIWLTISITLLNKINPQKS